ncbi:hypothetical protein EMPS_06065 [Entomortierella parvispora]|uniref:Uncharacterized protein n=1 Tax=Entomortierella parvispora TaxID=205924 RepID=A0A9P3HBR3_9FUNG|nr:hypothetical protein EMPS_06065 [Entomortierella parvispora]
MKSTFMITAVVAAFSTVSAYVCPDPQSVSYSCKQLNVFPLVCYNPKVNKDECNKKQCNQPYVDNYAACQCRRSTTQFYHHAVNVQGLINRCGGGLNNPFGNPDQYRPGQGTSTFPIGTPTRPGGSGPTGTLDPNDSNGNSATRIYNGTTYYGGQTGVVSGTTRIVSATAVVGNTTILPGTTTWVSGTPGIIRGTSTPSGPAATGKPATRYYNGTTYYGGQNGVVSGTTRIVSATAIVNGTTILPGTTTWVSGTPGIIRGTSTPSVGRGTRTGTTIVGTTTAQPILAPTDSPFPVTTQSRHISGGAIAGIVLGLLAAALLAGLIGLCWRRTRAAHVASSASTHIAHAPPRTIVTEKIEPVVVKAVPADHTLHGGSVPTGATSTDSTAYSGNTGGYNTQPHN